MNIFKQFVLSKVTLTDKLLDEISDYDIYCELTGIEFELGKAVISPIRTDDNVPSFSLFIPTKKKDVRPEEVWWRDFRDGSGDVFKFTQQFALANYGVELNTRKEVIEFIDNQLQLGIFGTEKREYIKRDIDYEKARESKEILFKSRPFTIRDLIWWARYGVDEELLNAHNIRSIKYLLNEDFTIRKKISIYDLAFAFIVYDKVKVYRPEEDPSRKWRNSCPSEYIQGWEQLQGYDTLVITKSYKDVLVFKSFMNVDVIAPQSESGSFTEKHIEYIKANYQRVYVVYDYDEAGKIGAKKLEDDHGFTVRWVSTLVDENLGKPVDKDISDYVFNHGYLAGINRMKKMFPELDEKYFRMDRISYFDSLFTKLIAVA